MTDVSPASSSSANAVEKSSTARSYLLYYRPTVWRKHHHCWGVFKSLIAHSHRYQASSLPLPLQLCKENLHHVLQETLLLENACLKASVPGSTESQTHYQCRTDLFGVAKKCVRQLEAEVCDTIMKTSYWYLLAEAMFLKIQLTFKARHFPTVQGPLMGFHMFIASLLKRLMNILTTRHVLICGTGRSEALNTLESVLAVSVPGHLCAWEN